MGRRTCKAAKGEIAWKFKWNQQHLLPSENKLDVDHVEVDAGDVVDYSAIRSSPSGELPHPYDAEELVES